MASDAALRGPHSCLGRGCGHPDGDHLGTPELAGPAELVVWCVSCRRHEVRRARGFWVHLSSDRRPKRAVLNRSN